MELDLYLLRKVSRRRRRNRVQKRRALMGTFKRRDYFRSKMCLTETPALFRVRSEYLMNLLLPRTSQPAGAAGERPRAHVAYEVQVRAWAKVTRREQKVIKMGGLPRPAHAVALAYSFARSGHLVSCGGGWTQ